MFWIVYGENIFLNSQGVTCSSLEVRRKLCLIHPQWLQWKEGEFNVEVAHVLCLTSRHSADDVLSWQAVNYANDGDVAMTSSSGRRFLLSTSVCTHWHWWPCRVKLRSRCPALVVAVAKLVFSHQKTSNSVGPASLDAVPALCQRLRLSGWSASTASLAIISIYGYVAWRRRLKFRLAPVAGGTFSYFPVPFLLEQRPPVPAIRLFNPADKRSIRKIPIFHISLETIVMFLNFSQILKCYILRPDVF